jgi:RHS repeat-associated protein
MVPHWSFRGLAIAGTMADGTAPPVGLTWPARDRGAFYGADTHIPPTIPTQWWGNLLDAGGDAAGFLYRRNRYFSPTTGQFTQEDPLGTAGGLNLYGFGDGDPVNYSDPFGLCAGPHDLRCVGATRPGALGTFLAAVGDVAKRWWSLHGPDVMQIGLALVTEGASLEGEGMAFRPDIELIGGRSGAKIASLEGPASSYVRGGGSRVFETNASGRIVRDISPGRVKILETNRAPSGQTFDRWRKIGPPGPADLDVLRRMGVIK